MDFLNSKKTLAVTGSILFLCIIYFFFLRGDGSTNTASTSEDVQVGQDILILVDKLNTVSIDTSIFSSPLYLKLKDFSVGVTEEPRGRANPFSTFGADVGTFVAPQQKSQTTTPPPPKTTGSSGSSSSSSGNSGETIPIPSLPSI